MTSHALANAARFPNDFMFQLTRTEAEGLRLQIGASNESASLGVPGLRFQNKTSKTQRGGRRYLPYAFTDPEEKYDTQFKVVFDAIRELMTPPEKPKRQIGFHSHE